MKMSMKHTMVKYEYETYNGEVESDNQKVDSTKAIDALRMPPAAAARDSWSIGTGSNCATSVCVCLISARLLQFHPSRATNDNAGTATASSPLRSATRSGPQALGPRDSHPSRSSLATNQAENRLQALPACPSCSYCSSTVLLVRAADGGGRCSRTCFAAFLSPPRLDPA